MISEPVLARIKSAVRSAIADCGGVEGAAATTGKAKATAGNWHNLNAFDTPVLTDALALDEVAIVRGKRPPILSQLASELGYVAIRLPDPGLGTDALTTALIDASAEFGDIASAVRDATRNGDVKPRDRDKIIEEIDEAAASLAVLRSVVEALGETPRKLRPAA